MWMDVTATDSHDIVGFTFSVFYPTVLQDDAWEAISTEWHGVRG